MNLGRSLENVVDERRVSSDKTWRLCQPPTRMVSTSVGHLGGPHAAALSCILAARQRHDARAAYLPRGLSLNIFRAHAIAPHALCTAAMPERFLSCLTIMATPATARRLARSARLCLRMAHALPPPHVTPSRRLRCKTTRTHGRAGAVFSSIMENGGFAGANASPGIYLNLTSTLYARRGQTAIHRHLPTLISCASTLTRHCLPPWLPLLPTSAIPLRHAPLPPSRRWRRGRQAGGQGRRLTRRLRRRMHLCNTPLVHRYISRRA